MPLSVGTYRFQNISANDYNYLTLTSNNQVEGAQLADASDAQKWKVSKRSDGYYDITNVGTGAGLVVTPPQGGSVPTITASNAGSLAWNFEPRGQIVVIKGTGQYSLKVVDLSSGNRVILWDPNNQPNQHWVAESVDKVVVKVDVQWVPFSAPFGSDLKLPYESIMAGYDYSERSIVCVARAHLGNGKIPAVIYDNTSAYRCYAAFNDTPTFSADGDYLVGKPGAYRWITYPGGKLDLNKLATAAAAYGNTGVPVGGCSTPSTGPLYIIRAMDGEGSLLVGKAGTDSSFDRPNHAAGGCAQVLVMRGGHALDIYTPYEVLCYGP